ncbi:MAG TPA: hypothetical protein PLK58_00405 [Candidatus Rifleibacterium sp.]|jgi:hypothetical protein|nr:hypothetical protein [Candidatus Rifleibacterium sp.]HPW57071.1 hypothetical protein [Candidatus Rifleibacterium sp.]
MSGLIPINLVFFMLMAIGGASMAVVDGVAGDWQTQIIILWALFNAPYLYFLFLQMRAKKDAGLQPAADKAIYYTNWLALPGAMSAFFLVGSINAQWLSLIFPLLQIVSAAIIFNRAARNGNSAS